MPVTVASIYDITDDALQNMFTINLGTRGAEVPTPPVTDTLDLRVTELTIPEVSFETYDIHYKTLKRAMPSAKTSFNNEFSFSMRVDRAYAWYRFFYEWNQKIIDIGTGGVFSTLDPLYAEFEVEPVSVNSSGTVETGTGGWKIHRVIPKMIPSIALSQETGEPVIAEFTFLCSHVTLL